MRGIRSHAVGLRRHARSSAELRVLRQPEGEGRTISGCLEGSRSHAFRRPVPARGRLWAARGFHLDRIRGSLPPVHATRGPCAPGDVAGCRIAGSILRSGLRHDSHLRVDDSHRLARSWQHCGQQDYVAAFSRRRIRATRTGPGRRPERAPFAASRSRPTMVLRCASSSPPDHQQARQYRGAKRVSASAQASPCR